MDSCYGAEECANLHTILPPAVHFFANVQYHNMQQSYTCQNESHIDIHRQQRSDQQSTARIHRKVFHELSMSLHRTEETTFLLQNISNSEFPDCAIPSSDTFPVDVSCQWNHLRIFRLTIFLSIFLKNSKIPYIL